MIKNSLILIAICLPICVFSQTDSLKLQDNTIDFYAAGSLSTSGGTSFKHNSYPAVELGICKKSTMFGLSLGRGNFDYSTDKMENYWLEGKMYAYKTIDNLNWFVISGWGQYLNSNYSFIEYGLGVSYNIKKISLSMTVSSWDNIVYISPGIAYNFSYKRK